jgi:hypothetical protein
MLGIRANSCNRSCLKNFYNTFYKNRRYLLQKNMGFISAIQPVGKDLQRNNEIVCIDGSFKAQKINVNRKRTKLLTSRES